MFDTLVLRDVLYPEDIFFEVEEKLKINGFRKARIAAERMIAHKMRYATIDDIYTLLPEEYREKAKECEIEIELQNVCPNPVVKDIYKFCVENNKKIYAISDMYLPADIIKEILAKCGYRIEKIYVSCDYKAKKSTGELFSKVQADLGISGFELFHIGDNYKADVCGAKKVCGDAFFLTNEFRCKYYRAESSLPVRKKINRILHNKLCFGYGAKKYSFSKLRKVINNRLLTTNNRAEQIGYEVFGPVCYFFCQLIQSYAKKNNVDALFFAARDTKDILFSYETLFKDRALPHAYFRISRCAMKKIKKYLDGDRSAPIMENADGFEKYLHGIGFMGRVLLIDLGWSAHMFDIVLEFCKIRNIQVTFAKTCYFAKEISKRDIYHNKLLGAQLFTDRNRDVHIHCLTTGCDAFFSETCGTCLGYEAKIGQPILAEQQDTFKELADLHQGIKLFIETVAERNYCFEYSSSVRSVFYTFFERPCYEDSVLLRGCGRTDEPFIVAHSAMEYLRKPLLLFDDINNSNNSIWKGGFFRILFHSFSPFFFECYLVLNKIRLLIYECLPFNSFRS